MAVDDKTLIRKIKSGNRDAFDTLIPEHYNDIYTYCFRKLGNRHDAQDITQEVFLHFCQNFDSYTQKGKCRNYLFVIAHNLCINAMRKKSPVPLEGVEETGSSGDNPFAGQFETADSIQAALNELPEEQKEVILLRFYHDFKLKEIARIMSSGLSVTKYRLSQGLKTLSRLLSREDWL